MTSDPAWAWVDHAPGVLRALVNGAPVAEVAFGARTVRLFIAAAPVAVPDLLTAGLWDASRAVVVERVERVIVDALAPLVAAQVARSLAEHARDMRAAPCLGSDSARRRRGLVAAGIERAAALVWSHEPERA